MAVYTEVKIDALRRFLNLNYDIGDLISAEGIIEGVENTNYALETNTGQFILTLFEKRTPVHDLPFFMALMNHLAKRNIPCPLPIKGKNGTSLQTLEGKKAAIVTFVPGKSATNPSADHCRACGEAMARLHLAAANFIGQRLNPLNLAGCHEIFDQIKKPMEKEWPGLKREVETEITFLKNQRGMALPTGIIHADLFPDNVHFEGENVSGIIDFYFACTDALAYDIAIVINSWCFDKRGQFQAGHFAMVLEGYESVRPLTDEEKEALPVLLRQGALRFLLTRAQDWLYPPEGVLGITKDPLEYMKILSFHREKRHISDYL